MLITFEIPDSDWYHINQVAERGCSCSITDSIYYLSLENPPNYNITLRLPLSAFKACPSSPRSLSFLPSNSLAPSNKPSLTSSNPLSSYHLSDNERLLLEWSESRTNHLEPLVNSDITSAINIPVKSLSRAKNSLCRKGLILLEAYDDKRFVIIPSSLPNSSSLLNSAKEISNSNIF